MEDCISLDDIDVFVANQHGIDGYDLRYYLQRGRYVSDTGSFVDEPGWVTRWGIQAREGGPQWVARSSRVEDGHEWYIPGENRAYFVPSIRKIDPVRSRTREAERYHQFNGSHLPLANDLGLQGYRLAVLIEHVKDADEGKQVVRITTPISETQNSVSESEVPQEHRFYLANKRSAAYFQAIPIGELPAHRLLRTE